MKWRAHIVWAFSLIVFTFTSVIATLFVWAYPFQAKISQPVAPLLDQVQIVATVNGEPITTQEFQRLMLQHRALVYDYFHQTYSVQDSATFWTTPYGGEIPIDRIREKALQAAVRIKVQQVLARQQGVIRDISEATLVQQLEAENQQRAERVRNGEVVYGPVTYNIDTYSAKVFADMITRSEQIIAKNLVLTDEVLQRYYEQLINPNGTSHKVIWGNKPFAEVRDQVKTAIIQEEYEHVIDVLVRDSSIVINQPLYNQVTTSVVLQSR